MILLLDCVLNLPILLKALCSYWYKYSSSY